MKLVSDYITSIVKGLNSDFSEIDDFDYLDKPNNNCSKKFDIDFGEYDLIPEDQYFQIGTPFKLKIFYSYQDKTKDLYFHIVEQAKILIRSLLHPKNFKNIDITNVVISAFNIEKLEGNKKLLTLSITGQATVIDSL